MRNVRGMGPLVAVVFSAAGCSDLTHVSAPDVLEPGALQNATGAQALRAGAITRFTDIFAGVDLPGTGRSQVVMSGTMADEFTVTNPPVDGADNRTARDPGDGVSYSYASMQRARLDLRRAIAAMQQYSPSPPAHIGQLFALTAYIELFFVENMCSGVPLSEIKDGQPVFGEPLTTAQMLALSLADFDSARKYAADSARILNLARIGYARALLTGGRISDAAAAAAPVASGYVYATEHSTTIQQNGIYWATYLNRGWTIADREGINGLDFRSANDPRVQTQNAGPGYDGVTPAYGTLKYNTYGSPVALASGIEARLIEAEAALKNNPNDASPVGNGWLGILNSLRAAQINPPLSALGDPGNPAARVDLLFREWAFWLFATGHRHGDLRRLVRQYGRDRETVFPTGAYRYGLSYGKEVTFTPAGELDNPNYTKCLTRDP
jgi:starch-binding outer membrane protein, SusD/RagB family